MIWYKGLTGKPLSSLDAGSAHSLPSPSSSRSHSQTSPASTSSKSSQMLNPNNIYDANTKHFTNEKYSFDTSRTPSLVINSLSEDDSGDYRCRIDYKIARTRNYVVRLNVIGKTPFFFRKFLHNIIIIDGNL